MSALRQLTNHPYYKKDGYRQSISLVNNTLSTQCLLSWAWLFLIHGMVLLLFCFLYFEIRFVIRRRKLPPGDSGWPFFGHFIAFCTDAGAIQVARIKKFGSICSYNFFWLHGIIISDDEDIQWAMAQERKGTTKGEVLPHFIELIGSESIFFATGENHKRIRKIFGPLFSPITIKDYAQTMDEVVQTNLNRFAESDRYLEAKEWALLTTHVFFHCVFGQVSDERMEKLVTLFQGWVSGFRAVPIRIPGLDLARAHHYKQQIFAVFREMIDEYKAANPPPSKEDGKLGDHKCQHKSVLGRLIYSVDDDGNMPSDQTLMDNLLFFTFAGFDTTKASLGALFHYLKLNPKAEEALAKEVRGFSGQAIDADQLKYEAPVLNAVMAETFRLMPPLSGHTTRTLVDLAYKDYMIPKGTFIQSDIYAHNILNDERYPEASEYHFERWLPKEHPLFDDRFAIREKIDYNVMSSKFRSFNMGQHMCLGGHFAKMEVRIVVARILQKYTVEVRNETLATFPVYQLTSEFKLNRRKEI